MKPGETPCLTRFLLFWGQGSFQCTVGLPLFFLLLLCLSTWDDEFIEPSSFWGWEFGRGIWSEKRVSLEVCRSNTCWNESHTVWKSLNSIFLEIPKNVDVGTDLSRWTVGIRVTERIAGHILTAHHLLQQRDNVWEAHHYVCTVGKAVVPPMFGRFVLTYTSHVW